MVDQQKTLRVPDPEDDPRSDRELLLETNRIVHALAKQGTKTITEIEHTISIIEKPVTVLDLSERTMGALATAEIRTVRALLHESQRSLVSRPAITRLALSEIKAALAAHGLRLSDSWPKETKDSSDVTPDTIGATKLWMQPLSRAAEIQPAAHASPQPLDLAIKQGDLVRHPKMAEWGVGHVKTITSDGIATITFERVGDKMISTRHINLIHTDDIGVVKPRTGESSPAQRDTNTDSGKVTCCNCGQPTLFTESSSPQRHALGWCNACFQQSGRTFSDRVTGEKRYFDELRTVDGIRHRYFSPK